MLVDRRDTASIEAMLLTRGVHPRIHRVRLGLGLHSLAIALLRFLRLLVGWQALLMLVPWHTLRLLVFRHALRLLQLLPMAGLLQGCWRLPC